MRNLFLSLVLANLGYAAWSAWFRQPAAEGLADRDTGVAGLTLVAELEEAAMRAVQSLQSASGFPVPGSGAVVSATQRCVSLGPFEELAQAAAAGAALRSSGLAPSQRVVEGDIWVGYWVHLTEIPTRSGAEQMLQRLHESGIADAYIVPGGEESQTISLGVFSEVSRAANVHEQARSLGYSPAVTDRSRRGTLYWIDVGLGPGDVLDLETLQAPGRINRLEQRPCP
jgi:hypothetical protein